MIPVVPAAEPATFHEKVREPGLRFLAKRPQPAKIEWKRHAYWTRCNDDLMRSYHCMCAYSCHRIERVTGCPSVDHFVPKTESPGDAYEWLNYRLAASRFNRLKGTKRVLDPFTIRPGTFALHFPSLQVVPGPACREDPELASLVRESCRILELNHEATCIANRQEYVWQFCAEQMAFQMLQEYAPFLAGEMENAGVAELQAMRATMRWPFERGER